MRKLQIVGVFVIGGVLLVSQSLGGAQPLRMRVTPLMSIAPGNLTVRINLESADENRLLRVVAESDDFYRASEVPLNGASAAPVTVFEFRNLPRGNYQISSALVGVQGLRATAWGEAKVHSY